MVYIKYISVICEIWGIKEEFDLVILFIGNWYEIWVKKYDFIKYIVFMYIWCVLKTVI